MCESLAKELSDETKFGRNENRLYYFVREGIGNLRGVGEGFAKKLEITSEMFEGRVMIDCWYSTDLLIGDSFTIELAKDNYLRSMQLDLGSAYYDAGKLMTSDCHSDLKI